LHDTARLESKGIPAVPVATHEFMTAARAQASALGRPDLDAVYVAHPIQDQTRAEIEQRAALVIDEIAARLVRSGEVDQPGPGHIEVPRN
jgi:hypothetical protein